jgi:pimeloyl-ACP methyl ester carboxylesterase
LDESLAQVMLGRIVPSRTVGNEAPAWLLDCAELAYAVARQQEAEELETSVDSYFAAVQYSWPLVERSLRGGPRTDDAERAWHLYHSAVAQLIEVGQQNGRFDPQRGVMVLTPAGKLRVEPEFHGFVWQPSEFGRLIPVGDYAVPELTAAARQEGIGVPLVVAGSASSSRRWIRSEPLFAATALVLPVRHGHEVRWVLALHDPLRSRACPTAADVTMAYDLTAPFAYRLLNGQRDYLTNFLQPGASSAQARLFMVEPYQPGKIPLLFVHGLLSDPLTWADMANALLTQPEVVRRYQLWGFEYNTGEAFLLSAAQLRAQLRSIREDLDPDHRDPELDNIVVVGHSMGGLLAKLQVTTSGQQIWSVFAKRPFESIDMPQDLRREVAVSCFFSPSPSISRVVFVGTPHGGSAWAGRCIGHLGAALVSTPTGISEQYRQMIADNPDAFQSGVTERPPRSIEMMQPGAPLLRAIYQLPFSSRVTLHSIIGTGGHTLHASEPSDGVVPVASAQHPGVASQLFVDATHVRLHRHPDSIHELLRILHEHATMRKGATFRREVGVPPAARTFIPAG